MKLKEALELELEERRQVDDVINFFVGGKDDAAANDYLNDE